MSKITTILRRRQLDKQLSNYRALPRFKAGYIREIRDALGMTGAQLAKRLGVSQAATASMERSEVEETISLNTLQRAAEALDCRLVYALVPKDSLEETVLRQAHRKTAPQAENIFRSMGLELQSTNKEERDRLREELIDELIKQAGNELWK
jgi:predicted DNA-binding mobile mystery protein A